MYKVLVILVLVSACGLFKKKPRGPHSQAPYQRLLTGEKSLESAQKLYDNQYYEKAIQRLETMESTYEATYLESEIHYLKAKAYFHMSALEKAEESFRAAYHLWTRSEMGRAKVLYYLALVYEQQDEDDKMIASLIELMGLKPRLDDRVYLLDLPAKLSSAYAREGNLEEAKRYNEQVERYLKQNFTKKDIDRNAMELVAKSLYELSSNSLENWENRNFEQRLESLRYSQFYLLRAIELGISPWAEKALYTYESAYRDLLDSVLKDWTSLYYRENKVSARRDQKRKIRQLEKISGLLRELKLKELPDDVVKTDIYKRYLLVNQAYEKEIEIYYLEPEVGEGLTEAAKKLLGVDKKIRSLKPQQLLKKYREQINLPVKDPNL